MALTNAERQAAFKEKKQNAIDELTATNAALFENNQKLQIEVKNLTEKLHKSEMNALKTRGELNALRLLKKQE